MKRYSRFYPIIALVIVCFSFFIPALSSRKLLLPTDTIVGLYHPYRDLLANDYPRGVPYKNALLTDPVRQQYPWKEQVLTQLRAGSLPLWNPYVFGGTPLLATLQAGVFYPLTFVMMLLPLSTTWNTYIILQTILAGIFMYLYLRNLKLSEVSAAFGGFVFAYSGFMIAWLEWGNIGHTALWLPLILLAIDRVAESIGDRAKGRKPTVLWSIILIVALVSSFFAGHLQTFFYLFLVSFAYGVKHLVQTKEKRNLLLPFALSSLLFAVITSIQWLPTLNFINQSGRALDQYDWHQAGWFIPWQHIIQFVSPDFFGNPATLNYFGVWNYAEFIGYVGIAPLLLALLAIMFVRQKQVRFFIGVMMLSLIFAFPTFVAMLPFTFSFPFLSTAQPTRLMFLVDVTLSVLAAYGLDYLIKEKKYTQLPILLLSGCLGLLWIVLLLSPTMVSSLPEQVAVAKRNMQLPTLLLGVASVGLIGAQFSKHKKIRAGFIALLLLITVVDLFRFTAKFTPVSERSYLYPETKTISYLKKNLGNDRYMALDSRILPPNFSVMYGLQTVEGYDPLYLKRYGQLIASSERKKPDVTPPLGFNRIITPREVDSPIINLLGVSHVLSLNDISYPNLQKVMTEGETRIYRNTDALPRAFLVENVTSVGENNPDASLSFLFGKSRMLRNEAVVESNLTKSQYATGSASINTYSPEKVLVDVQSYGEGFLVLTDAYYPTWKAYLVSPTGEKLETRIYLTDYALRGVVVPQGRNTVEFTNTW